jgi:hypothetical protein
VGNAEGAFPICGAHLFSIVLVQAQIRHRSLPARVFVLRRTQTLAWVTSMPTNFAVRRRFFQSLTSMRSRAACVAFGSTEHRRPDRVRPALPEEDSLQPVSAMPQMGEAQSR